MNFDEAIGAHVRWKIRLLSLLDGSGESVDAAEVSSDTACELGRWIHGDGCRYGSRETYAALLTAHASFHRCAGRIASLAGDGRKAEAEALLTPGGEFARWSDETVIALMRMQREALE